MRWLQRSVGLAILGTATLGAVLLWVGVAASDPDPGQRPQQGLLFGVWRVFYDTAMPSGRVLVAAAGVGLLLAAAVAALERRITNRARRSENPHRTPLAPKLVMAQTRGEYAGPVTVTVLIPAHNEEAAIGATLRSLLAQSVPPARIVVVADNCTDQTVPLARAVGVDIFETVGNTKKKAGALNQALREVLPGQGDNDLVMVMDADTTLDQGFLAGAARRMTEDRALMAVGGLFYGEEGAGLIGQFQRNEYIRYQRELKRRRGRVFVLTGTASVFRPRALRAVAAERGETLPGVPGDVYDTIALTEDNELTMALKSLGALMISPPECTVVTEVMPSWGALWAQRLRWQRGALENLGAYGMRPSTFRNWMQQLGIGYGVIALSAYVLLILMMVLATANWVWFPFWLGVGGVFVVERVVTVWRGGWRARLLGLSLFPELFYAMFLNVVYVKGVWDLSLARQASWKHVVQTREGIEVER
ncbi:glycosyltransferase family 2 protein [Nocardioides seonyuensis]|uniref:Glycosyltransferase family 2 protein n=1 Tax=Nocardioides seonyuensis TaxID=2518371 RepID=A0A4P7IDI2_9ACTN|nr:glycosyltransferase family 2 protein [Nocardioides seonyuensis]QBX55206.1 glycosyltransferase family 2 protein [Nocardioides seonyuensis]